MKLIIVDKDGAKTTVESEPGEWCYVEYSPSFKAHGLKDGFEKIVMPKEGAYKMTEWIPTSTTIPSPTINKWILVYNPTYKRYSAVQYMHKSYGWGWYEGNEEYLVEEFSHWAYLPEPPK